MSESRSQLEGVFLAIAAFTCFVLADTCVKAIGKYHVPAFEVVSAVSVMEMVLLASFAAARGQLRALWPHRPLRPVLRSLLDLVNNLCVVIAVRHLPLALFYILVFLAPAVTTLLEAVFLKERLSGKRWLAVITGFIGVVIAVNPFGAARAGDRTGYLACMVCVACFSVNLVWSRRISQGETPQSLTFFSSMVQAGAGVALAMIPGVPFTLRLLWLFAATALVSLVGSLCFFVALRHTSAATVSQYHYTQLLTGAAVAFLLWRERPTVYMIAGAVLIVVSGWVAAGIARRQEVAPLQM